MVGEWRKEERGEGEEGEDGRSREGVGVEGRRRKEGRKLHICGCQKTVCVFSMYLR